MAQEENELIKKAQGGNVGAFEELVYRYDQRVLRTALRFTHDTDLAQDIYQDVFLRVHRNLRRFRFESLFSTWLYRIVANVSLTHIATNKGHRQFPLDEAENEQANQTQEGFPSLKGFSDPDRRTRNSEIRERIAEALHELSPQQRTVFILRHYEGCKLKDIAAIIDCAEGTVKKHLFNATMRMREQLRELQD